MRLLGSSRSPKPLLPSQQSHFSSSSFRTLTITHRFLFQEPGASCLCVGGADVLDDGAGRRAVSPAWGLRRSRHATAPHRIEPCTTPHLHHGPISHKLLLGCPWNVTCTIKKDSLLLNRMGRTLGDVGGCGAALGAVHPLAPTLLLHHHTNATPSSASGTTAQIVLGIQLHIHLHGVSSHSP